MARIHVGTRAVQVMAPCRRSRRRPVLRSSLPTFHVQVPVSQFQALSCHLHRRMIVFRSPVSRRVDDLRLLPVPVQTEKVSYSIRTPIMPSMRENWVSWPTTSRILARSYRSTMWTTTLFQWECQTSPSNARRSCPPC